MLAALAWLHSEPYLSTKQKPVQDSNLPSFVRGGWRETFQVLQDLERFVVLEKWVEGSWALVRGGAVETVSSLCSVGHTLSSLEQSSGEYSVQKYREQLIVQNIPVFTWRLCTLDYSSFRD